MTNDRPTSQLVSSGDAGVDQSTLELRLLASICDTSSCPTIYESDRGTVIVQGYAVSPERVGVALPDGEFLVEIPATLLATAARVAPESGR